jgi:hypothetical protein
LIKELRAKTAQKRKQEEEREAMEEEKRRKKKEQEDAETKEVPVPKAVVEEAPAGSSYDSGPSSGGKGGKGKGKGETPQYTISLPGATLAEEEEESYELGSPDGGKGGKGAKGSGKGGKGVKVGKGKGGKGGKGPPDRGKGGKGKGVAAAAARDKGPKSNTIGLHWNTISNHHTLENSIWGNVDADEVWVWACYIC